jgi:hypothetical protein
MSSSQEVVLYDLPSQQGVAWSLNPWKSEYNLLAHTRDIPRDHSTSRHNTDLYLTIYSFTFLIVPFLKLALHEEL